MKKYAGFAILGLALLIAWFATPAQLQGVVVGVGIVVLLTKVVRR